MNIISMHSHKGGVGKSTFGLFFAKYLAHFKSKKKPASSTLISRPRG